MSPRRITNISEEGAYIDTDVPWCSGTLIKLRIQEQGVIKEDASGGNSIVVDGMVVRRALDGFALQFLFDSPRQRKAFRLFLSDTLKRQRLMSPNGVGASQSGHSLIEFALLIPLRGVFLCLDHRG